MYRPSTNTENSRCTREKPLVPRVSFFTSWTITSKNSHRRTRKKTKVYIYLYISLYENHFENGCIYIYFLPIFRKERPSFFGVLHTHNDEDKLLNTQQFETKNRVQYDTIITRENLSKKKIEQQKPLKKCWAY